MGTVTPTVPPASCPLTCHFTMPAHPRHRPAPGSPITGGTAVLTAIVGFFGLPAHFGFRKNLAAGS